MSVTAGADKKIVSISVELPYFGVDTGGGQTLFHHYRVVAERCHRVDVFAPGHAYNAVGVSRQADIGFDSYNAAILEIPRWRSRLLGRAAAHAFRIFFPAGIVPDIGAIASFVRSFVQSDEFRRRLKEADLVELQHFEHFFLARIVRAVNPNAEVVGIAHDIINQKVERKLATWPAVMRRPYLGYVRWLERKMLHGISQLAALSEKDAGLLTQLAGSAGVMVLNPPLELSFANSFSSDEESARHLDRSKASRSFGFVSALHRKENDDAALWLLSDIWPRVLDQYPTAELYIVGSRPSDELVEAATIFAQSVRITGYVENLEAFYDLFDTAVIPLRFGAGIKNKTIAAILAGKNIVATPIAVEGTLPDKLFFCVSESPTELADAMVRLAKDPEAGKTIAKNARSEAGSRYSGDTYARTLSRVYPFYG